MRVVEKAGVVLAVVVVAVSAAALPGVAVPGDGPPGGVVVVAPGAGPVLDQPAAGDAT